MNALEMKASLDEAISLLMNLHGETENNSAEDAIDILVDIIHNIQGDANNIIKGKDHS